MRSPALAVLGAILLVGDLAPQPGQEKLSASDDAGMVRIGGYYIDVYEYPNREGALPRVDVTWSEARDLCGKRGKRLCTEGEWEKACRGPDDYLYGYGPVLEQGRCNTPRKEGELWLRGPGVAPSGSFEGCASGHGVRDLIGNVWEWTDGWYSPAEEWHVVRGGSWFHSVNMARADGRYGRFLDAEYRVDLVGFRCCRSAAETDGPE